MTSSRTASAIRVEIIPALAEHEPILANLLELYAHDFTEFKELKLGADGRFGYKDLPLYWKESDHYPFLIEADGHLAGFALVRRGSEISGDTDVWDMTEFFVVRGSRRLGVGTKAAQKIWGIFGEKWEVRVIDQNQKVMAFWRRAINDYLGKRSNRYPSTRMERVGMFFPLIAQRRIRRSEVVRR